MWFSRIFALGLAVIATGSQAQSAELAQPATLPGGNGGMAVGRALVFDASVKEYRAKPFEMSAPFVYYLTNVWTNDITITEVKPSCGCTTASMPATPWTLHAGDSGAVEAKINLMGKMGTVTKTLTFHTSLGVVVATLRVVIPPPNGGGELVDRNAAMMQAKAEPMAIFKNNCAQCHVDKGRDAMGEELYMADCGICHESSHRATFVPDLHALKHPTDLAYWELIISEGKPHTMMPGFSRANGGPLSVEQIASLAEYLNHVIAPTALGATAETENPHAASTP